MDTKTVARLIKDRLINAGVVVQYYESYSSTSIYLKFDFGLSNSLRIGDHYSKKGLEYMFNVDMRHKGQYKVDRNKFARYTYSQNDINFLVNHILEHRKKRQKRYGGIENYQRIMLTRYEIKRNEKGFWQQSQLLNPPELISDVLRNETNEPLDKKLFISWRGEGEDSTPYCEPCDMELFEEWSHCPSCGRKICSYIDGREVEGWL